MNFTGLWGKRVKKEEGKPSLFSIYEFHIQKVECSRISGAVIGPFTRTQHADAQLPPTETWAPKTFIFHIEPQSISGGAEWPEELVLPGSPVRPVHVSLKNGPCFGPTWR